jgi:hypothetical protein
MGSKPVILAFGYEAGSGKDTCADYLYRAYGGCKVLRTSFAKSLRFEVHQAVHQIAADYMCPPREAIEILCYRRGVKYDPFAEVTQVDPYGKQRLLLQDWGAWKRYEDPEHWIKPVDKEIAREQPDLVYISDLRHINEGDWTKSTDGYNVHVYRPDNKLLSGAAASHVSECELVDYPFDHKIVNDGTLKQLHTKANKVFHEITQGKLFT